MPASTKKQAHTMAMALAVKRDPSRLKDMPEGVRGTLRKMAASMTQKQLREFSHTAKKKK